MLPVALTLAGCAHVATLCPAAKGALEAELSFGGPMLRPEGVLVPGALTSFGVRYGLAERADVQLHVHPTAALLGTLGLDVGSSVLVVKRDKAIPDVTATVRFFGFANVKKLDPFLQLGLAASWRVFNRFAPYVGVDALTVGPSFGIAMGVQGTFGRFTIQLEGKWFRVGKEVRSIFVEWLSPKDIGTFGAQLGMGYRFLE